MINVNPKNEEKRLMSLWVWLVSDETCNLLEFLTYFCYYSLVSLHFLNLFIDLITLFSYLLVFFSIILSVKKFQFQLNKLFSNEPYTIQFQVYINILLDKDTYKYIYIHTLLYIDNSSTRIYEFVHELIIMFEFDSFNNWA